MADGIIIMLVILEAIRPRGGWAYIFVPRAEGAPSSSSHRCGQHVLRVLGLPDRMVVLTYLQYINIYIYIIHTRVYIYMYIHVYLYIYNICVYIYTDAETYM